jgi:hypothetical protein
MSYSNSHLREIRGRPLRPEPIVSLPRGQRRPRSPEVPIVHPVTPLRSSSPELTLITKSPYSNITIKKGKTGDGPVPHTTPHEHTASEPPKTGGPSTDPVPSTKTTPTVNLPEAPSSAQTLLEYLTRSSRPFSQLLQNNSDVAHLDTSCTKQVLRQLSECLNSRAATQAPAQSRQNSDNSPTPTQKKSYAEATSTTKRPAGPPHPQQVRH